MSVDTITESFKPLIVESSIPVEKLPATQTHIVQILNDRDNHSSQEAFQQLSSLEIPQEPPKNALTAITQPENQINTSSEDQSEVDKIRNKIRSFSVSKEEPLNSDSLDIQSSRTDKISPKSRFDLLGKIKNIYEKKQREKVEKYRRLFSDDWGTIPSEEGLSATKLLPLYKQLGRIVLDTPIAKIIFPRLHRLSNEQQDKEAENIAATEYHHEKNISTRVENEAEQARLKAEEEAKIIAQVDREAKIKRDEQEEFEKNFFDGMDKSRENKIEYFRKQRAQEIIERLFNQRLTRLEDIDLDSSIEGSGLVKRHSDGVVFYDMKGYQFRFLQHAINYKYPTDGQNLIGSKTAKELIENPSLWRKSKESTGKTGGQKPDSKSNIIAMSYINTEVNLNDWGENLVYYGFDSIEPGTLINSIAGDGGTSNHIEEGTINLHTNPDFLGTPEYIDNNTWFYNEVDVWRYDSNGNPQLPKFIIVRNWYSQTLERRKIFLRHAKYFNIPIIDIDTQYYKPKPTN